VKTRALVVSLVVLAGCQSAPEVVAESTAPTLAKEDFAVVTQSLSQIELKYTGTVAAGSETVTVEKARWEFVVDGVVKTSGEDKLGMTAAAGQVVDFELDEMLQYVKDEEELREMDARGGSLLLAMRGTLVLSVPVAATKDAPASKRTLELPFARSKEVRTPRLPRLKLQDFEASRVDEGALEVQAVFHLGVVNPNPFQVSITGIEYQVELAGKEVNKGTIGAGERVSNASTGVFDVSATLSDATHGKDAQKIVKGLVIPYVIKASLSSQLANDTLESKGEFKLKAAK
jgi:LEA14-like dessication related protein